MPTPIGVSPYERLPYRWPTCAAPDCGRAFPTQHPTRRYCSAACAWRVGYYRRLGRPVPDRASPRSPVRSVPRVCADERCGRPFAPSPSTRIYCCRACGNRHRARLWYRRHRAVA